MRNMSQRGWAPTPPVEQLRRTGKKRCYGHKSGGQYVASSVQPPTHLLHSKTFSNPFEPFQIKWEVYFSKELCRSSLLCRCYDSACICICVCIVVHGYTTKSVYSNLRWQGGFTKWFLNFSLYCYNQNGSADISFELLNFMSEGHPLPSDIVWFKNCFSNALQVITKNIYIYIYI